jgi:hypothetical protein
VNFGFLKEKLKEQELLTSEEMIEAITPVWNGVTFEEMQSVFCEWAAGLAVGLLE